MPLYDIKCDKCEKIIENIYRTIAEMDDLPECCGQKMRRMICAPRIISDIHPYQSQATGEWITSRSKHKQHLKDNGLVEVGDQKAEVKGPSQSEVREEKYKLRKTIAEVMDAKGV